MIARGFKPVAWVAAVAGAALGCYMLSLNVAAERAELASLERQIILAKQDIRSKQTELGTRGRMSQLEQWNAEILALSSPASNQYLEDEVMLARFDQRDKTIGERTTVQLASAEAPVQQAAPAIAPRDYAAAAEAAEREPAPLVRRASLTTLPEAAPVRETVAPPQREPRVIKASAPRLESVAAVVKAAAPVAQPAPRKAALINDSLMDSLDAAASAEKKIARKGAATGQ
ncbi:hypothetical protein [Allosphingosinicella indica]|uniref:Uncharacterized protein n=1 Tax=Allosphingosinicella indica TaxID=941907 RepID=A0A1X7G1B9_9SPHN|nr:hypothetical protein [Allosphingosinicella indica]SMF61673.1 hypothetical protein SAMN06295910_0665 [Allosphingosinicella indica]